MGHLRYVRIPFLICKEFLRNTWRLKQPYRDVPINILQIFLFIVLFPSAKVKKFPNILLQTFSGYLRRFPSGNRTLEHTCWTQSEELKGMYKTLQYHFCYKIILSNTQLRMGFFFLESELSGNIIFLMAPAFTKYAIHKRSDPEVFNSYYELIHFKLNWF